MAIDEGGAARQLRHFGDEMAGADFAHQRGAAQAFVARDGDVARQDDQHAEAAVARLEQGGAIRVAADLAIALQAAQFGLAEDGGNLVHAALDVEAAGLDGIVLRGFGDEFGCACAHD